jgi:hypothetical protein
MAPFEGLYDRHCHTLVNWVELGERTIFGLDLIIGTTSIPI